MPTSQQASLNQMQRYLEQLYGKSNTLNQLQTPPTTRISMADQYLQPSGISSISPANNVLPMSVIPTFKQTPLPAPPPFNPTAPTAYPEQLHDSGISNILAGIAARSRMSNAIPNMNLTPGMNTGDAFTGANLFESRLANAAKTNPGGVQTSQLIKDKIAALNNPQAGANPLSDIEAQIRALASTPDIPGQWISPYSQDYLNQLGTRLGEAGSAAQQEFNAAKGDVVNNYLQANQVRDTANSALTNELQNAGGNIGINYNASNQGKQAASDAAYLSQMAGANQATDTSFMDKMGQMAALSGSNLGMQAQEGLLTPKQYVGPRSGLTAGQQALIGFLQDKYNQTVGSQDLAARIAAGQYANGGTGAGGASAINGIPQISMTADESSAVNNPDFINAFNQLPVGPNRDLIQRYYDASSGNVADALAAAQKAMDTAVTVGPTGFPLGRTGIVPRGASTPTGGGLDLAAAYAKAVPVQGANWQAVIDFLRKYDPAWNPVTTQKNIGSKSTTKYNTGAIDNSNLS